MRNFLVLLLMTACGGAILKEQLLVTLVARALPPSLPVGETTTIAVRAWYPRAFEFGTDRAYDLVPADIRIRSTNPETLRAVGGVDDAQHQWDLEMPVTTQTEQFGFECVREGSVQVLVGVQPQSATIAFEPEQTLIIECAPNPTVRTFEDLLADLIDSISSAFVERNDAHVDLSAVQARILGDADALDVFTCGATVICSGIVEGPVVHITAVFDGPIPEEPDHFLVYALVAQTDDDASNDWVAQSPFDWDLFQQADWWLQLIHDPSSDWRLELTVVQPDQSTRVSTANAIVVRQGARLDFFIPLDDVGGLPFDFRVTSFAAGDSTYPQDDRGGDVPGANPTESLLVLE